MTTTPMRLGLLALALSSACASGPKVPFHGVVPRSILVVPPLSASTDPASSRLYLSTITRPLAERGYYVFPVAVVERMMRDNGLPTPLEMNEVPLEKLVEVFHPDAVLYTELEEWGTTFQVLNSRTAVTVSCRLVDAATGEVLWAERGSAVDDSSQGMGQANDPISALIGALIAAIIHQAVNDSDADAPRRLASVANTRLAERGLPAGPYLAPSPTRTSTAAAPVAPDAPVAPIATSSVAVGGP